MTYYLYEQTSQNSATFDSYQSDNDTHSSDSTFSLYAVDVTQPQDVTSEQTPASYSKDGLGQQLVIDSLFLGRYILSIASTGTYDVQLNCGVMIPYTCGEIISGYYGDAPSLIRLITDAYVLFDACEIYSIWRMSLYDAEFTTIPGVLTPCSTKSGSNFLVNLIAGDYSLEVFSWAGWELRIICFADIQNNHYVHLPLDPDNQPSWVDANIRCMNGLGTSLATIKTQSDVGNATEIIQTLNIDTQNLDLFIGLYKEGGIDSDWRWADGSSWFVLICAFNLQYVFAICRCPNRNNYNQSWLVEYRILEDVVFALPSAAAVMNQWLRHLYIVDPTQQSPYRYNWYSSRTEVNVLGMLCNGMYLP